MLELVGVKDAEAGECRKCGWDKGHSPDGIHTDHSSLGKDIPTGINLKIKV